MRPLSDNIHSLSLKVEENTKCLRDNLSLEPQLSIGRITDNLQTLSLKIDENTKFLKENSSMVKSYAEVISTSAPSSCEQLRQVIKEEEDIIVMNRLENDDKRRRETNIMVYGLAELNKEDDAKAFVQMAEELDIKAKVTDSDRIGKITNRDRPHPLRIKLDSKYWKEKILSRAHKLKPVARFSKVYIRPDLTPKERAQRNILREQLKQRISEQLDTKWVIKDGQVSKGRENTSHH